MHHHAQLIFIVLVEMGFHHVGQAGLELLASRDSPASTSQSAGITGVNHHTWSQFCVLKNRHSIFITVQGLTEGRAENKKMALPLRS